MVTSEREIMEFIEEYDVKFIRLAFFDLLGNQKKMCIRDRMYTVLQGKTVEAFTIHITKVHRQNTADVKGIEFKIDDEKLASASNGIVQGMSGSPIVQDGKIIGAVTHVITSHPSNCLLYTSRRIGEK